MNNYVQLKELKMGLGEAMTRIDKLGSKKDRGIATAEEREEYNLLM